MPFWHSARGLEASLADLVSNGSAEDLSALATRIALAKIKQDQAETPQAAAMIAEADARAEADAEQDRSQNRHGGFRRGRPAR
ncbi:hypothetical protein SAMN05192568_10734 [Methylobacterium pseudosasicola]|uniref:Uncharacterized protein n=1 Tax=Methylobacterium pseudosasicola TaxID=582667 RepID=A0A1I4ULQ1_9HYPH|nr:hypothetical protein SAMN05192568_10734 [Methylobacterium pseudosasicola]